MLIIKKRKKSEPATFIVPFRGQEITLTVRPTDSDEVQKIIKKHTRYTIGIHPVSKQAVRIGDPDNTEVGKDVMDILLVGFSGVFGEDGKPLPVTRDNKMFIAAQVVKAASDGEEQVLLANIIQQKAMELAEIIEIEAKEDEKNSGGAPVTP